MHISLFIQTAAGVTVAGVAMVSCWAAIYFPTKNRKDAKQLLATKTAADELAQSLAQRDAKMAADLALRDAKVAAMVVERDIELKNTVRTLVVDTTEQVKKDLIERIDVSDRSTHSSVVEVKDQISAVQEKVHTLEVTQALQFGGNGNGIRQSVNELGKLLAGLDGKFAQHVAEVKQNGTERDG